VPLPSFSSFLDAKPLYYKEIDHLRVHRAYARLKSEIRHPQTIHIVGTNGKGSTGRMIAHLAYLGAESREEVAGSREQRAGSGFSVGHFSSPHILKFNERIWLDGSDVDDETLSIITPIGIDHQAFLGDSIEEIARTKIRSIQKRVLLAPQPYPEVEKIAEEIAREKGAVLYWSVRGSGFGVQGSDRRLRLSEAGSKHLERIIQSKGWPAFLGENAAVALQALDLLRFPYEIDSLMSLELFGRFYPFAENIRIDVGHNPLAARAIAAALKEPVVLIYNSLDDKDYEMVLQILKPKVKRVEILPILSQRAATLDAIRSAVEQVGLPCSEFNGVIDEDEKYLVFGSFYTVEAFIKMEKGPNVSE